MSVSDFTALQRWNTLSKEFQQRLLSNVFCRNCFDTTVVQYAIKDVEGAVVLDGYCKTCNGKVKRVVEDI